MYISLSQVAYSIRYFRIFIIDINSTELIKKNLTFFFLVNHNITDSIPYLTYSLKQWKSDKVK